MDKNKKLFKKEKLKKEKDKEKLKKEKDKEKLKKQKDKEKLKKEKQKEKLKKQKDKEKRKIRKKIYKGGEVTTREKKRRILQILSSWEREDDADDYFEMWKKHFDTDKRELFIILNYNFLTELQIIKDLIHEKKLTPSDCSFEYIMKRIKPYSFLTLLAETINEVEIDDNKKKLLFIEILKNLINTYIFLTNNIFNETIFPQIGEPTALYRTWRNNHQLESMRRRSRSLSTSHRRKRQKVGEDILITDNYLSTSRSKELALRFYKNSYGGRKEQQEFILWKIEIPAKYPNLHVSDQLKEVLLHVGSRLKLKTSTTEHDVIIDGITGFKYTEVIYEYMGYKQCEIDEIINKYKEVVEILSRVSGIHN